MTIIEQIRDVKTSEEITAPYMRQFYTNLEAYVLCIQRYELELLGSGRPYNMLNAVQQLQSEGL